MTDIECPQCGHRALSVATRCPRCGHEFSADLLQPLPAMPHRPWLRPVLTGAGVVAVVVVLSLLARRGERNTAPPVAAPVPSPAPEPAPAVEVPPDTAAPAGAMEARTVPLAAQPARAPDARRRYATNWINVREGRGLGAPLVRVLQPGDAVLVDSLVRGWYRVLADGRTLGYAHRRYLTATPPAAAP